MTAPIKLLAADVEHLRTVPSKPLEADEARRIREEFGRVVAFVGHKQAAAELGTQESTLSHMIAGRGQRYPRLDWAPKLLRWDPTLGLARAIAEPAEVSVQRDPRVTPEEMVVGFLRAASRFFGPGVMEPLMAEAHREALSEAAKRRGG